MITILFAIFQGKKRPHFSLAGDRDVGDRKAQSFAIATGSALMHPLG